MVTRAKGSKIGDHQRWTTRGPSVSSYQTLGAEQSTFPVSKRRARSACKSLILSRSANLKLVINAPLINVSQKTKGNKTDYDDLVTRIVQLLDPIRKALENQSSTDVDLSLKEDLERFTQYVLYFLLPILVTDNDKET